MLQIYPYWHKKYKNTELGNQDKKITSKMIYKTYELLDSGKILSIVGVLLGGVFIEKKY